MSDVAQYSHHLPKCLSPTSLSPLATGNANDDCYPQEESFADEAGLKNYSIFAAVIFVVFFSFCLVFALSFYLFGFGFNVIADDDDAETKPKLEEDEREHDIRGGQTKEEDEDKETRPEEDDMYALTLSKICKDSVYSYLVTDKPLGWLLVFATLGIQIGILAFFIIASEANLQDDKIDIEFTWKCPRDSVMCDDRADLTKAGWVIFVVLMIAFLAKDFINGSKLIYYSSKSATSGWCWRRVRCFLGGASLFSITAFALYVSSCYNDVHHHPLNLHKL